MATSIHDYLIDHSTFDWRRLLSGWKWLLPPQFVVWLMNRFGDMFVVLPDDSVHVLNVAAGTLTKLADTREAFCDKLDSPPNADDWLRIALVDRATAAGMSLRPDECYGFKTPPARGGDYTVENVAVEPIRDYLHACGTMHQRLRR